RGPEVDLAMREEPLCGPGESPAVRHRPGLGLVLRYGERKSQKVTRLSKARRGRRRSSLRNQMGGFRYLPGSVCIIAIQGYGVKSEDLGTGLQGDHRSPTKETWVQRTTPCSLWAVPTVARRSLQPCGWTRERSKRCVSRA